MCNQSENDTISFKYIFTDKISIPLIEALEFLTDGGNDAKIDGLHIGDLQDNEFVVTIFQGKYKQKLDNLSNFPENSVVRIIDTVRALFF